MKAFVALVTSSLGALALAAPTAPPPCTTSAAQEVYVPLGVGYLTTTEDCAALARSPQIVAYQAVRGRLVKEIDCGEHRDQKYVVVGDIFGQPPQSVNVYRRAEVVIAPAAPAPVVPGPLPEPGPGPCPGPGCPTP